LGFIPLLVFIAASRAAMVVESRQIYSMLIPVAVVLSDFFRAEAPDYLERRNKIHHDGRSKLAAGDVGSEFFHIACAVVGNGFFRYPQFAAVSLSVFPLSA